LGRIYGTSHPRVGQYDRHRLLIDQDGSVIVAGSNSTLDRHMLVRVRVDSQGPFVDAALSAPASLVAPPFIDLRGYHVAIRSPTGMLQLKDIATLPSVSRQVGWAMLAECVR